MRKLFCNLSIPELVPCEIENGTGNIIYSVLLLYLFLFLALWIIVIK